MTQSWVCLSGDGWVFTNTLCPHKPTHFLSWWEILWKAEHSGVINSHTQKLSYLSHKTLRAGLPVVTKFFLLLRFPSMLWDYQVKPNIGEILKVLQCLGWNQIRHAHPLWHQPAELQTLTQPAEKTHREWKPIMLLVHCAVSQSWKWSTHKTVRKFAEITVNIYSWAFIWTWQRWNVFPFSISFCPQGLILDKILNSLITAAMHHVSICN